MTTGTAYSDAIADLLLDDANDLTPAFEAVLEETFVRFDEDEDKALSDAELDAFATALNGAPFSSAEKTEIKEYFNTDTKGLTLLGFKEMYHMQTNAEPEETWSDLKKLGFETKFTDLLKK